MSSGTCNAGVEEKGRAAHCFRPMGHPGDHMAELLPVQPGERCEVTMSFSDGVIHQCTNPPRHVEDHYDARTKVNWPKDEALAGTTVPHSVRARVELHRAQTEYDLTVLRNRIDCLPTVNNINKELRRRREQLTAELDAWSYLAKVTDRAR